MDDNLEINRLHNKLYLAYQQDGILNMVIGLVAIGFSLFMATEGFVALMISWLPMLLYLPLKQSVTRPRFGYVRFTPQRVNVARMIASIVIGLLVLVIFMALTTYQRSTELPAGFNTWMQAYHMAVMGSLAGMVAIGVAIFTGMKRFYIYGLLAFMLPLVGALLELPTYLPITTLGLLVTGSGLALLITFLRTYPKATEE